MNVTNITYDNSVVHNYGPDYNRISAYSTRKIPCLELQRETNVDFRAAGKGGAIARVQGNQLLIAGPMKLNRPAQTVAPKVVKTKIEKPNLETGWNGITDPKKKADLQAKFKTEDAKSIPQPKMQPVHPEELKNEKPDVSPAAKVATSASPSISVTPAVAATSTPTQSATPVPHSTEVRKREDDLSMPLNTATPTASPNESKTDTRRSIQKINHSPAPTATPPVGAGEETKSVSPRLRPERPVFVPNPPDGSGLRTTNKPSTGGTSNESNTGQGVQQLNERQLRNTKSAPTDAATGAAGGGEPKVEKEKGNKGRRGEQVPSPTPGQ